MKFISGLEHNSKMEGRVLENFVERVADCYRGGKMWKCNPKTCSKVEIENGFDVCVCGGTSFVRLCFTFEKGKEKEKISIGERCCMERFYSSLNERWELQKYGLKKGWVILGKSKFTPDKKWK